MKNRMIILLTIVFIIIVFVSTYFIINNSSVVEEGTKQYECIDKENKKQDYIINNIINLQFENGKINFGDINQIYRFYDKEKYNNFELETSMLSDSIEVLKQDEEMTITYKLNTYIKQNEKESVADYIAKIEANGYKCILMD